MPLWLWPLALWSAHFDLLSDMDELNTSVSTMELVEDEAALQAINPLEAERHKYVVRYEHADRAFGVQHMEESPHLEN